MRNVLTAVAVIVVAGLIALWIRGGEPPRSVPDRPLPNTMAAIGDSITQAVAVDRDALGAAPEHSWATGADAGDPVQSHYERLVAAGALKGAVYNNSVPGAKMADAVGQAETTVSQKVDYVVILMGANDVCAPSTDAMTSPENFEAMFMATMSSLSRGLPNASIYVVSIPNITRLWDVGSDQLVARTIWNNAGICQSVLAEASTDAQREVALERTERFNEILEAVCSGTPNCLYDGGAAFEFEFSDDEVGPLDYFHPSMEGQAHLAEITWRAGYWAGI